MSTSTHTNSCPTTMNPFNLTYNKSHILIPCPDVKYSDGDLVTVSKLTFYHRLSNELGNLFDWTGIFIAGGFLSGLTETKYDPKLYTYSDIDMYVSVPRMTYLINHLKSCSDDIYFIHEHSENVMISDCLIQGWKRRLQIIGVSPKSLLRSISRTVKWPMMAMRSILPQLSLKA